MEITIQYDKVVELPKAHHLYGMVLISNKGKAIGYLEKGVLNEE